MSSLNISHRLFVSVHTFLSTQQHAYQSFFGEVHVHVNILSKIHPACHSDTNGIKACSNSNLTEKHAAWCSKAAYLGEN